MCQSKVVITSLLSLFFISGLRAAPLDQNDSNVQNADNLTPQQRSQAGLQQQMVSLMERSQQDIQKLLQNEQREQLVFQQQESVFADQPDMQNYIAKQEGVEMGNQQNVILQHQKIMQQQQQTLQQAQLDVLVNQQS